MCFYCRSGMLKSRGNKFTHKIILLHFIQTDDYDSAGSMRHRISADDNNKDGSANNQAGQQSSLSDGQPGSKEGTHDQSGDHDRKLHGFRDSNKSKNAQLDVRDQFMQLCHYNTPCHCLVQS